MSGRNIPDKMLSNESRAGFHSYRDYLAIIFEGFVVSLTSCNDDMERKKSSGGCWRNPFCVSFRKK